MRRFPEYPAREMQEKGKDMKPIIAMATAMACLIASLGWAPLAWAQDAAQRVAWNRPFAPFKVAGNVYYVGTEGLSAYLVTGPKGHILIDGGLPESAPLIAANIRTLGFRLHDVKYLLINHAHFDHAGGLAALKRATGAKLLASAGDAPSLAAGRTLDRTDLRTFPKVRVDERIGDGKSVRLGSTVLTAHLTPGHTRGCTSWSMRTAGRTVLFACSLTVAGNRLYPQVVSDFRNTFRSLRGMKADIFLNFHPDNFDMAGKRTRQKAGDADAFVDRKELGRQLDRAEQGFAREWAREAPRG